MAQHATPVCANISVLAATPPVSHPGGVGVLIVEATTYPITCQLQTPSVSGKWVPVGPNIAGDGLYSMDLPAGLYRMQLAGGAVSALYATLVSIARK